MIDFIHFLPSGEIVVVGSCPESQYEYQSMEECMTIKGSAKIDTQYIDTDLMEVRDKQEMPLTGEDFVYTVPPNTYFNVQGPVDYEGQADTTGDLEFQFDEPGEYTITFKCFPYLDKIVTIYAD